jgi:hypothetical protein
MMTAEQEAEALADLARAREERDSTIRDARQGFADRVRAYEAAGISVSSIAVAAGFSRQRVYQIRDGRLGGPCPRARATARALPRAWRDQCRLSPHT